MKRGLLLAAAVIGIGVVAGAYLLLRSRSKNVELTANSISTLPLADGAPGFVVAHRSSSGEVTEIELLRAADGGTLFRRRVDPIQPESDTLVAAQGFVVMAGQTEHLDTVLIALDAQTGQERWRSPFDDTTRALWIHEGTLVALSSGGKLYGFELGSGKKLWETSGVDSLVSPIFVAGHALIPSEHARSPALRLVNVKTGAARDVGRGLGWPGAVVADRYYAVYSRKNAGEALVTPERLRDLERGMIPGADAAVPARSDVFLAEVVLGSGEVLPVFAGKAPVALPGDCEEPTFFALFEDRVLVEHDERHALFSTSWRSPGAVTETPAPPGFNYWDGGSAETEWSHRERWAYLAARSRFVPMVLNQEGSDNAKLCILDLRSARTTWCSAKSIDNAVIPIFGWLHVESLGDTHFIHFPLRENQFGPLLILDGKTGKFRGAIDFHSASGKLAGFPTTHGYPLPRSGDVVALRYEQFLFGLDLAKLTLAFQRGPEPVDVRAAMPDVENLLGDVPK